MEAPYAAWREDFLGSASRLFRLSTNDTSWVEGRYSLAVGSEALSLEALSWMRWRATISVNILPCLVNTVVSFEAYTLRVTLASGMAL